MINGTTGKTLVYGAVGLLALLVVAITVITISNKTIPEFFLTSGTLLVGFLIGSRVVTPDVSNLVTKANAEKAAEMTGSPHA